MVRWENKTSLHCIGFRFDLLKWCLKVMWRWQHYIKDGHWARSLNCPHRGVPEIYIKTSVSVCQFTLPVGLNDIWCFMLVVIRHLSKPIVWIFLLSIMFTYLIFLELTNCKHILMKSREFIYCKTKFDSDRFQSNYMQFSFWLCP